MKRFQVAAGAVVIAALLSAIGAGATAVANTETEPQVRFGEDRFYTEEQMDAVWQKVVTSFSGELPKGVKFSETAPRFFHPDDAKVVFQEGLPEEIAARFWRCAWIDQALDATDSGKVDSRVQAIGELTEYAALPGVAEFVDVEQYESDMLAIAEWQKTDPLTAEFGVDCEIYTQEGYVR